MLISITKPFLQDLMIYLNIGNGGKFVKSVCPGSDCYIAAVYFDNYPDYARWSLLRNLVPNPPEVFFQGTQLVEHTADEYKDALTLLVRAKRYKEEFGDTSTYQEHKKAAWAAAFNLIGDEDETTAG